MVTWITFTRLADNHIKNTIFSTIADRRIQNHWESPDSIMTTDPSHAIKKLYSKAG